jgi:hypothetical protein
MLRRFAKIVMQSDIELHGRRNQRSDHTASWLGFTPPARHLPQRRGRATLRLRRRSPNDLRPRTA